MGKKKKGPSQSKQSDQEGSGKRHNEEVGGLCRVLLGMGKIWGFILKLLKCLNSGLCDFSLVSTGQHDCCLENRSRGMSNREAWSPLSTVCLARACTAVQMLRSSWSLEIVKLAPRFYFPPRHALNKVQLHVDVKSVLMGRLHCVTFIGQLLSNLLSRELNVRINPALRQALVTCFVSQVMPDPRASKLLFCPPNFTFPLCFYSTYPRIDLS